MQLSKAAINSMQLLRQRLRAETGVDIRISQPDALQLLIKKGKESAHRETRALAEGLLKLVDPRQAASEARNKNATQPASPSAEEEPPVQPSSPPQGPKNRYSGSAGPLRGSSPKR